MVFVLVRLYVVVVRVVLVAFVAVLVALVVIGELSPTVESASPGKPLVVGLGGGGGVAAMVVAGVVGVVGGQRHSQLSNPAANSSV